MKRKLNENDIPEEASAPKESVSSFEEFGLDPRLLQGIGNQKYTAPTQVQAKTIPLAIAGKDVLVRARTGSGKTLAYVLPLLQSILRSRNAASHNGPHALILVPTRELANQVTKVIKVVSSFCAKNVHIVNVTTQINEQAQRALLSSSPDIVIATPARASLHLNSSALNVERLSQLVIDEADLVLSYGYEEDFDNIVKLIPQGVQTFLVSATLTTELDTLKGLFCRDPVVLDLKDEEKAAESLNQYALPCAEDDKFLLTFALFKLKLVHGKCIIFVSDIDRCYRVKLFLEQFGIKSCVLNSELPVNSRIHVVEEFNKNVYDIIVATDEQEHGGNQKHKADNVTENGTAEDNEHEKEAEEQESSRSKGSKSSKKQRKSKKDQEYGISRGIDFHNVGCVLNFDLPTSTKSYTHRIGRTARAGRTGIAMSFVVPRDQYRKHKLLTTPSTEYDEAVLAAITTAQEKKGNKVQPYSFDMQKLQGFAYRVSSALKTVSPGAIREARLRELREEMLKSEKLKRHLEENPEDMRYLRHDMELKPARVQTHMRQVPDYLMPAGGAKPLDDVGFVGFKKEQRNRIRKARARTQLKGKGRGAARMKKADPLKTFNAKGRGK